MSTNCKFEFWGVSSLEQLEAVIRTEGEELREELRQADCNAAPLYARNMAIMDTEERGEEWVEPDPSDS